MAADPAFAEFESGSRDILGMLSEGVPHDEILRDFPYLEPDDIKAALAYAARETDHGGGRRGVS